MEEPRKTVRTPRHSVAIGNEAEETTGISRIFAYHVYPRLYYDPEDEDLRRFRRACSAEAVLLERAGKR
jgi:hypothetical protein